MDKWSYYRLCEIFYWPFGSDRRRKFRQILGEKNESFYLIYKNILMLLFLAFILFKNVVFAEILVDQILKFLVRSVSAKIKSFERFFKQCIFLLKDYLSIIPQTISVWLNHIWWTKIPEFTKNEPFHGYRISMKNF